MKKHAPKQKHPQEPQKKAKSDHVSFESGIPDQQTGSARVLEPGALKGAHVPGAQSLAIAKNYGSTQGNRFLAQMLQEKDAFTEKGVEIQRQPAGVDPEQAARQAFLARGLLPSAAGLDMQSATGIGGFNVRFDPSQSELLIRLRVGIDFRNSIHVIPLLGFLVPDTADFAAAAVQLNNVFPDPAARIAEVETNWQWHPAEQTQWAQDYAHAANDSWGEQHYFQSVRWPDVFANAKVELDVHSGHRANDHCKATVFKVPPGSPVGPGAVVNSISGNPTASTGTFTSSNLQGTSDFLDHKLTYPEGRSRVSQATAGDGTPGTAYLDNLISTFQRGRVTEGAPIEITGHASATGSPERNQKISEQRAENVAAYLKSHGQEIAGYRITTRAAGSTGADVNPDWRRVDIRVGGGSAQHTMMHETGHMLGLGDEYVVAGLIGSGTGGAVGTPVAHGALSQAMGGGVQGAVYENNDNIMSLGNAVRPQHYSTFLEALNRVSPERFQYGGPGRVISI